MVKKADTFVAPGMSESGEKVQGVGVKSKRIDQDFFEHGSSMAARPFTAAGGVRDGQAFTRSKIYPHQNTVADDGTPIGGRRARIAAVLASAGGEVAPGKKHHKKMKRVKQRSGKGYD